MQQGFVSSGLFWYKNHSSRLYIHKIGQIQNKIKAGVQDIIILQEKRDFKRTINS